MKRIIAFITVLTVLLSSSVLMPSSAAEDTAANYKADTLIGLGILSGVSTSSYKPLSYVKKYELVNYIYCMLGDYSTGNKLNTDAALYLEGLGIIDSAASINTSAKVTLAEAAKMLVTALGYGDAAKFGGDYPTGYITYAQKLRLLDGVSAAADEELKMYSAVELLYNAIECDAAVMTGVTGDGTEYKTYEDMTVLAANRGIYKVQGQVTADYFTTLYRESSLKNGEIRIEDTVFDASGLKTDGMFGYPVIAYYKSDSAADKQQLIYIRKDTNRFREITIDAEQIDRVTPEISEINYYDSADRKRTATLDLPKVIYNGQIYPQCTAAELMIKEGTLTLVDSDNAGGYDLVFADSVRTVVADGVNTSSKTVTNKMTYSEALAEIDLNMRENDGVLTITHKNDILEFSDIKQWDVLSVRQSKGTQRPYIRVEVSSDTRSGAVKSISESAETVNVDGKEYKMAKEFLEERKINSSLAKITVGESYTFLLTSDGKIAGVKKLDAGGASYGYALRVKLGKGLDGDLEIKLFDTDQVWKTFKFAKKSKHNGAKGLKPEELYAKLTGSGSFEPQLVKYTLNTDGEINGIETAVTDNNDYDSDRLRVKKASSAEYRWNDNSFDSKYYMDSANYWIIPADEDKYDEDSYRLTTDRLYLEKDNKYSIAVYDLDEYGFSKNVAVQLSSSDDAPTGNFFVVTEVGNMMTASGDFVQTITGAYKNYDKIMLTAEDAGMFDGIGEGDVLTVKTNAAGVVPKNNGFKVQYSAASGETPYSGNIYTQFDISRGTVVRSDGEKRRFTVDLGGGNVITRRMLDAPNLIIYYKNSKMTERGTVASLQKGDFIVYREFWANITDVVVIR